MPPYVVGCDGGTESIRTGIFDAATGAPVAFAAAPYPTRFPHPGWAEQDPADWWAALAVCVPAALNAANVAVTEIRAICLDTTCCSVVALDAAGAPLVPCLLWMDMRSASCAEDILRLGRGDAALEVNAGGRGPVSAEWMLPKALWLKRNKPEVYKAARYICEYQDYMNFHLTGRMVGSLNNASIRWHYSTARGRPASLLRSLSLDDLSGKWPTEFLPLGAVVGGLTAAAAAHLGLPEGLPVAQGGADAFVGMVGLGAVAPGNLALLTGSSHLHLGVTAEAVVGAGVWGTYENAVVPGLGVVEGGQTSTGSAVAWFRRLVSGGGEGGESSGGGSGGSSGNGGSGDGGGVSYEQLNAEAAAVPVGCEGLTSLDHFQGNRTPFTDPLSRGAFVGLTLKHGRGHLFRAIIEGICMGTELVFEAMRANGYTPRSVTVAGGAARSELWLQIHADVSNVPLLLTKVQDACCLGSAMLAAVGAGIHPDIPAAAAAMVHVARVVEPDPDRHREYAAILDRYRQLYGALRPIVPPLTSSLGPAGPAVAALTAAAAAAMPTSARRGDGIIAAAAVLVGSAAAPEAGSAAPTGAAASGTGEKAAPAAGAAAAVVGRVNASILAADAADLGAEVSRALAAGADWIHIDFVDGLFAETLTFGIGTVAALRQRHPSAFLDVHLACHHPLRYVAALAAAGATQVLFHPEAEGAGAEDAAAVARAIRAAGMRAGVAVRPETPVSAIAALLKILSPSPAAAVAAEYPLLDCVDVLAVQPGFGGQKFDATVLDKVATLREMCPALDIQVDGGMSAATAAAAVAAGANVLTAGSFIFGAEEYAAPVASLCEALAARWPVP